MSFMQKSKLRTRRSQGTRRGCKCFHFFSTGEVVLRNGSYAHETTYSNSREAGFLFRYFSCSLSCVKSILAFIISSRHSLNPAQRVLPSPTYFTYLCPCHVISFLYLILCTILWKYWNYFPNISIIKLEEP
jgi:hypothetical protein